MAKAKTAVQPALSLSRSFGPGIIKGYTGRNTTWQEKVEYWTMPEPNSGCLLWLGSVDAQGYPRIFEKGRLKRANRFIWIKKHGPIPANKQVLHKCDVTCCVNDLHFRLGTHQDNVDDKMAKGRHRSPFGNGHANTVIPDEAIPGIRSDQRKLWDIADEYGVTAALISGIKKRKFRRHIQ